MNIKTLVLLILSLLVFAGCTNGVPQVTCSDGICQDISSLGFPIHWSIENVASIRGNKNQPFRFLISVQGATDAKLDSRVDATDLNSPKIVQLYKADLDGNPVVAEQTECTLNVLQRKLDAGFEADVYLTNCAGKGTYFLGLKRGFASISGGVEGPEYPPPRAADFIEVNNDHPVVAINAISPTIGKQSSSFMFGVQSISAGKILELNTPLTAAVVSKPGTCDSPSAPVKSAGTVIAPALANSTWNLSVSNCTSDGDLTISLPAGVFKDDFGNPSDEAVATVHGTVDNTPPVITIERLDAGDLLFPLALMNPINAMATKKLRIRATDLNGLMPSTLAAGNMMYTNPGVSPCTIDVKPTVATPGNLTAEVWFSNCAEAAQTAAINKVLAAAVRDTAGNDSAEKVFTSTEGSFQVDNVKPLVDFPSASPAVATSSSGMIWKVRVAEASSFIYSDSDLVNTLNRKIIFTATNPDYYRGCTIMSVANDPADLALKTKIVNVTGCNYGSQAGDTDPSPTKMKIVFPAGATKDLAGNFNDLTNSTTEIEINNKSASISIGTVSRAYGNSSTTGISWEVTFANILGGSLNLVATTVELDKVVSGAAINCTSGPTITDGSTSLKKIVSIGNCSGDGTVALRVLGTAAKNLNGDFLANVTGASRVIIDNTKPRLAFRSNDHTTGNSNATFNVQFDLIEANQQTFNLTGKVSAVRTTGTTASCTVGTITYPTATIVNIPVNNCVGDGQMKVVVAAGAATDQLAQTSDAAESPTFSVDNTPPTLAVSAPKTNGIVGRNFGTASDLFTWDLVYSADATVTLALTDVTLSTDGTVADCVKSLSGPRQVQVTGCTGTGNIFFTILRSTAQDAAGNQLAANQTSQTVRVNNTAPTVSLAAVSSSDPINRLGFFLIDATYTNYATITLDPGSVLITSSVAASRQGCAASILTVAGFPQKRRIRIDGCIGAVAAGTVSVNLAAGTSTNDALLPDTGPAAAVSFIVDNVAPTVAITLPLNNFVINNGNVATPLVVSGTCSEAMKPVSLNLNGVLKTTATCGVDFRWTTTHVTNLLLDGNLVFTAVHADAATNSTTSTAVTVKKDTVDPLAPTLALSIPMTSPGKVIRPTLRATNVFEADVVRLYSLANCAGSMIGMGTVAVAGTSVDIQLNSDLGVDGDYTFYASTTDAAGNGPTCTPAALNYRLDTLKPTPPTIALQNPLSSPGKVTTPTIRASGVVASDTVQLFLSNNCTGAVVGSVAVGVAATSADLTVAPALVENVTPYSFSSNSTDLAGNISNCSAAISYRLDTTKPVSPSALVLFNPSTSPGKVTTPMITVRGVVPTDQVVIYSDVTCTTAASLSVQVPAGVTEVNITLLALATEGAHTFWAGSTDLAGNASDCSATSVSYTLDTVKPGKPSITLQNPSTTPGIITTPSFTVANAEVSGDIVVIYDAATCPDAAAKGQTIATSGGPVVVTTSAPVTANVAHTYWAAVTDRAGNKSDCSDAGADYLLDTNPPATPTSVTLQSPATPVGRAGNPILRVFPATAGDTVTLFAGAGCIAGTEKATTVVTGATGYFDIAASGLVPSAYIFFAKATDSAGNSSACSATGAPYQLLGPPSDLALTDPATSPGVLKTPTILVSGVVSGDLVKLYTTACTGSPVGMATATDTTVSITASMLADGVYTFHANATDAQSNVSGCSTATASYTLDSTGSTLPMIADADFAVGALTDTSIYISWRYSTGPDASVVPSVERSVDGGTTFAAIDPMPTVNMTGSTYYISDTGLVHLNTYHYRVRATKGALLGVYSTVKFARLSDAPRPITGLTIPTPAVCSRSILFTWANTPLRANYDYISIERAAGSMAGPYTVVAPMVWSQATQFTDTGLTLNTHYYYRVVTHNQSDADVVNSSNVAGIDLTTPAVAGTPCVLGTVWQNVDRLSAGPAGGSATDDHEVKATFRDGSKVFFIGSVTRLAGANMKKHWFIEKLENGILKEVDSYSHNNEDTVGMAMTKDSNNCYWIAGNVRPAAVGAARQIVLKKNCNASGETWGATATKTFSNDGELFSSSGLVNAFKDNGHRGLVLVGSQRSIAAGGYTEGWFISKCTISASSSCDLDLGVNDEWSANFAPANLQNAGLNITQASSAAYYNLSDDSLYVAGVENGNKWNYQVYDLYNKQTWSTPVTLMYASGQQLINGQFAGPRGIIKFNGGAFNVYGSVLDDGGIKRWHIGKISGNNFTVVDSFIGDAGSVDSEAFSATTDGANLLVAGSINRTGTNANWLVKKYTPTSPVVASELNAFNSTSSDLGDSGLGSVLGAQAITFDVTGNLWVGGYTSENVAGTDYKRWTLRRLPVQ